MREVALFLEGRGGELLEALRARMKAAAQALRFEQAARLRDQLFAIERSLERQKIATTEPIDQDVFGYHREADRLVVYVLYVRQGRLNGGQAFPFTGQEFPDEELIGSFVNLYYGEDNVLPDEVLLPLRPEGGVEPLSELLTEKRGRRVRVLVPQRGEKLRLVEMSAANARQALLDQRRSRDELEAVLERLQDRLHLTRVPRRMECFDISHFQGAQHRRQPGGDDRGRAGPRALPALPDQERAGAGRLRLDVRGGEPAAAARAGGRRPARPPGHRRRQGAARLGAGGDEGRGRRHRRGGPGQVSRAGLGRPGRAPRPGARSGSSSRTGRTPSSCRRTRPSCSCWSGSATRRTASPSPISRS